jgi:phage shock protein A
MADVGLAVQRAKDKTQALQARADAVSELTTAGALEDFTATGDDIDRELSKIGQSGQVDDELAKLKAELGQGEPAAKELPSSAKPDASEPVESSPEAAES